MVLKPILALNRAFWDDNVESRRKRRKVYHYNDCRDGGIYPPPIKLKSEELFL